MATLADLDAVLQNVVSEVDRVSFDVAQTIKKLNSLPLTPDVQEEVDKLTKVVEALDIAADNMEAALTPPVP